MKNYRLNRVHKSGARSARDSASQLNELLELWVTLKLIEAVSLMLVVLFCLAMTLALLAIYAF